jgi:DNA-binding NtrC family response regulator
MNGPVEASSIARHPGASYEGTVLLVDDEPWVRMLIRRMLTYLGFDLLEAATAEQAMDLAGRHAADIDLLLTDVVLPDRSGFELSHLLLRRQPELKVLYVTGHATESAAVRDGLRGAHFLNKPFRSDELEASLRRVLSP